jgi:glycosyltransferase-like protein
VKIRLLTYSTKPRGGVVHAMELGDALTRRGHEVELWALSVDGAGFFREPRCTPCLVPVARVEDESVERRILRYADALAGALRRTPHATVEHAQDCLSARSLLTLRLGGRQAEIVRTVHHVDEFRSAVLDRCQRASILDVDHRICVSRYWADELRARFGVPAHVIPNGVDAARFRGAAHAGAPARERFGWGDRTIVLTVGGIEPRKGSRHLLEAFARLRPVLGPRPLLAIAGGETLFDYADYRASWLRDAQALELEVAHDPAGQGADVALMGRIADEDMPALYAAADVFTLPSTREGFGLVALEAMAAGCPVVLSDLPVFHEHFSDGEDCLMAPVGDVRRLAAALEAVVVDPDLRERLRAGGAATVDRYTWDAAAAAHERLYEAVA